MNACACVRVCVCVNVFCVCVCVCVLCVLRLSTFYTPCCRRPGISAEESGRRWAVKHSEMRCVSRNTLSSLGILVSARPARGQREAVGRRHTVNERQLQRNYSAITASARPAGGSELWSAFQEIAALEAPELQISERPASGSESQWTWSVSLRPPATQNQTNAQCKATTGRKVGLWFRGGRRIFCAKLLADGGVDYDGTSCHPATLLDVLRCLAISPSPPCVGRWLCVCVCGSGD